MGTQMDCEWIIPLCLDIFNMIVSNCVESQKKIFKNNGMDQKQKHWFTELQPLSQNYYVSYSSNTHG